MKFLKNSLEKLSVSDCTQHHDDQQESSGSLQSDTVPNTIRKYELPLVRLDISLDGEGGGVTSAIAGLMTQPTGEKICTLQVLIYLLYSCQE
jgi:hypothetical protein